MYIPTTAGTIARKRTHITVGAKMPVSEVLQIMVKNKVTAVCVMRRGKLIGIFTMRDVMKRVLGYRPGSLWSPPKRRKIKDVAIRVVMTPGPLTIEHDVDMPTALEIMRARKIRHLPVMRDGNLVGVLTLRDALATLSPASGKAKAGTDTPAKKPLKAMYFDDMFRDYIPVRSVAHARTTV